MNVFKPDGERFYHVFFRYGPEQRQVNRSTGKTVYTEAKVRAAEIFAKVISEPQEKEEVSELRALISQLQTSVSAAPVSGVSHSATDVAPSALPPTKMKLNKALAQFLEAKSRSVSFHQLDALKVRNTHLVQFCQDRGLTHIHQVTPGVCDAWLKTKNVALRTQRGYMGDISSFLNWCTKYPRQWLVKNPVSALEKPRVRSGIPTTLTVTAAREFMEQLEERHPDFVTFYALCLIAGARPDKREGELTRLAEDIACNGWARYVSDRIVTISRPKVGNPRNFPLTDNLREWLQCYPKLVIPTQWQHQCLAKEFKLSANVLRHTAISAFVTMNGSMAEAAVAFGNSETMIRRHYLNLMSKADAMDFYGIKPKLRRPKAAPVPTTASQQVNTTTTP